MGINNDLMAWALPEGAIARFGRGRVTYLVFAPNGNILAVGSCLGVWLYDVSTLTSLCLFDTERGMVSALTYSPNGVFIATGNWDGDIKVWEVNSQRCISKMKRGGRFDRTTQLVFSPDGQLLASSGGRYDAVYVWHPENRGTSCEFHR